jgi:putative ABC transport system permease protein
MLRITWKGLWARKRRLTGAVVAVVLGVAFLSGALALGDTLSANFNELFTNANAGTDAVVRSATTVGNGLDAQRPLIAATLVETIERVPGVAAAEPNIVGLGQLLGKDGSAVGGKGPPRIASNWINDRALNPYRLVAGRAPRTEHEVVINRGAATAGHLQLGDTTMVETPDPVQVRIVGIATFAGASGLGTATYTAFDLAAAERYLAEPGQVSSILVRGAPSISQTDLVARIRSVLPPGVESLTGAAVTQQNISDLSGAFLTALRTLLVVFAGIALLVATFSIANTFSILVAQRTREEALLRTIGASRRQVLTSVLLETLAVGAVASMLGLLGGFGIAGLLKGLFDAAGFALPAGGLVVTRATVVISLLAGVVVTVLAGGAPALRAARIAPLEALRDAAAEPTKTSRLRALIGSMLTALGAVVVITAVRGSGNGIVGRVGLGALFTTVGVIVLSPVVARMVTGAVGFPFARSRGVAGELARDNVMRNPRRSATAASALMIGVAVATLFTVFAASVKTSVTDDVNKAFVGDLALSSGGFGPGTLSPRLATAIGRLPGVSVATGLATGKALVGTSTVDVSAVDPSRIGAVLDLHETAGSIARLDPHEIAVSAHRADAKHWRLGTPLRITLPDGARTGVTVGAIYASRNLVGDYVLPIDLWAPHTDQKVDANIFVKLAPGRDVQSARTAVERVAAPYGKPTVDDHAAFVATAGQAINFVLGIVYVLLALAVVIALFGIANTLSLSIHERTREIGLLRAVGQTRRQLRRTIRIESVIVSLFGTLGGLALGTFLGWGLAQAAHRVQGIAIFTIPVPQLVVVVLVGAVAGVLAAIRPARRAARLDVLAAVAHD